MQCIPGSKTPQIIQFLNWVFRPIQLMEANFRRHGDFFRIQAGNINRVFACHPEAIRFILSHDHQELSAPGTTNAIFRPIMGDNSLILQSGLRHQRYRRLLSPRVHGDRVQRTGNVIRSIVREAMSELSNDHRFGARQLLQKISMQVIVRLVFGLDQSRNEELEFLLAKKCSWSRARSRRC